MSALSSPTERWVPRLSFLLLSSANQRSTRFSQELEVGVKCKTNRGWAASHFWIAGVLWVEALSRIRCTPSSAGTAWSSVLRNFLNSTARWRECSDPITFPVERSNAAYRLEVPERL